MLVNHDIIQDMALWVWVCDWLCTVVIMTYKGDFQVTKTLALAVVVFCKGGGGGGGLLCLSGIFLTLHVIIAIGWALYFLTSFSDPG